MKSEIGATELASYRSTGRARECCLAAGTLLFAPGITHAQQPCRELPLCVALRRNRRRTSPEWRGIRCDGKQRATALCLPLFASPVNFDPEVFRALHSRLYVHTPRALRHVYPAVVTLYGMGALSVYLSICLSSADLRGHHIVCRVGCFFSFYCSGVVSTNNNLLLYDTSNQKRKKTTPLLLLYGVLYGVYEHEDEYEYV